MRTSVLLCIAFACLVGFASSMTLKALVKFEKEDLDTLSAAVDSVKAKIVKERESDAQMIAARMKQRDIAKADYEAAEVRVTKALKAEADAKAFKLVKEAELVAAQTQYAAGKKVRDDETVAIGDINNKLAELSAIGGSTGGTLGVLPKAKEQPAMIPVPAPEADKKTADTADLQISMDLATHAGRVRQMREMLLDISRGYIEQSSMKAKLTSMKAAIDDEEAKDMARVTLATKVRDDAVAAYNQAVAVRQAEEAYRDKAKIIYQTAQAALEHDQAEVEKAEKGRKDEEDLMATFMDQVKALVGIRVEADAAAKKGMEGELSELQIRRSNEATQTIRRVLKDMLDQVKEEQQLQEEMMAELKAVMEKALIVKEEAITNHTLAVKFWEMKTQEYAIALGEWKAAEMALADERAVANEERDMIDELRDTIAALSSIKTSSGNCQVVDGLMCSGSGTCNKDSKCECNYGHMGIRCEQCKYNFHKENGICVPDTSSMSLLQYSAKDIGQILLSVKRDSTAAEVSGVSALLDEMIAKLDKAEKDLVDIRDAKKVIRDTKEQELAAAKVEMDKRLEIKNEKIREYEKAKQDYDDIYALYQREQPLREKEYQKLGDLNGILDKLEGVNVYEKKEFVAPKAK